MNVPNPVLAHDPASSWAPPAAGVEQPAARPATVATETAATLLFDSREQAESAVDTATDQVKPSEGQRKLSEIARKVAKREIRRAIVELLDVKLGGAVLKAWQRHGALLAAAQRTSSGGREVVMMADHTVTSTHSPRLELAMNGIEIGTITINIVMTLQLVGVNAVVQRGELTAVESGSMVASAKLSVEDVPVASRSRTIDAIRVIHLPTPIPLAAAGPASPPTPKRP